VTPPSPGPPSQGVAVLESELTPRTHHLPAAGLVVVAVGLLAGLPEVLGDLGRLAAVLVLQLGLVLTWVLVTGIQGFAGSLAVGAAAAVAADLALVLPEQPELGDLLAVFGVGFLAVVLQQMLRRPRHDLVASLSGALLLLCVIGALAALLLLGKGSAGSGWARIALLAVGAALVAGHLIDLYLPRPPVADGVPRGLLGLVLAVLTGAAVAFAGHLAGAPLGGMAALVYGAVLGGMAGLVALAASYLVVEATATPDDDDPGDNRPSPWALAVIQAVLPIAACAPVALALQAVL
jgi:hypothetical protein